LRGFATSSPQSDDKKTESSVAKKQAEQLLDHAARGIGQVIFLNSPMSGAVILGGLAVSSPYLASLGALGAVTATASAKAAGLDDQALKDGLWGYNGCLIGCAAAVFGPASMLACTSSTILGAAATPFVSATLKETMTIPQWTYSFNLVALTSLLRTRPLLPPEDAVADAGPISSSVGFGDLLVSPFTGISQIFVVESALSGSIIFYGIGMVST
jgi:urea transporter